MKGSLDYTAITRPASITWQNLVSICKLTNKQYQSSILGVKQINNISEIYLIGEVAGQTPISKPGKSFHTSCVEMQMLSFPIGTH